MAAHSASVQSVSSSLPASRFLRLLLIDALDFQSGQGRAADTLHGLLQRDVAGNLFGGAHGVGQFHGRGKAVFQ